MLNVLDNVCVGAIGDSGLPSKIAYIIAMAVRIIQIAVPVLLIIWGMLDLGKAVIAQKEEEIKKGQQTFVKRIVAAAIVFFVVVIVELVVGLLADNSSGITECIKNILSCEDATCSNVKK